MGLKENASDVEGKLAAYKSAIQTFQEKRSNKLYRPAVEKGYKDLNKSFRFLVARIDKSENPTLKQKFKPIGEKMKLVLDFKQSYSKTAEAIDDLENDWPDFVVEFESFKEKSFDIPEEIPLTENRLDLEEAIKDYEEGCYTSSLVMCRRSYEGALASLYKLATGKEPYEKALCPRCQTILREKGYFGIAKLHNWAIAEGFVTERLKQIGFLLSDMGAGAAHPPLSDFPRDPEIAKLGITATIALMKETGVMQKKKQIEKADDASG